MKRFLNQKLGKRTNRQAELLKARLKTQRTPTPSGLRSKPSRKKTRLK